jgi:hypothetical protein
MTTDFFILCAATVPDNYSWDYGNPFESGLTTVSAYTYNALAEDKTIVTYSSGYAPGLKVVFYNESTSDPIYPTVLYDWDFGDYYNDTTNNVTLSCTGIIEHTFLMPGKYTVTLNHLQTKQDALFDTGGNTYLCLSKFGINWYWDNLNSDLENSITWDQAMCNPPATATPIRSKWWTDEVGCFQKYCKVWSWAYLDTLGGNPLNWGQTKTNGPFAKQWLFQANSSVCSVNNAAYLDTYDNPQETVIKTHIIEVKEILPEANMYCVTETSIGETPLTVQLTPRLCKTGSFPIDKIVWDFGDGSPLKTITRYTFSSGSDITTNDCFVSDPLDVRNYDVIHTYVRTKNNYPVFYPSLTCYSSCTNTSDSCSVTIGPINLKQSPTNIDIIKVKNTNKGNLYAFDIDNNIAFTTTNPIVLPQVDNNTLTINIPNNPIKNSKTVTQYYGNPGINYPVFSVPSCLDPVAISPFFSYITTENNSPQDVPPPDLEQDGVPIITETEFPLIV